MKNVIVTGCAGFIGWKVSQLLLKKKVKVIGIDNINDYYDPALKEWRLSTLLKDKHFSFHKLDIADYASLKKIFLDNPVDVIINLAARAGVRASVEDPWVYLDTNVKGTLNLLECAKEFKVKKFVLASTSSLYGLKKMPFKEDDRTDLPLAPYSATKKGAEVLCYSYHYLYGLDVSIMRYFTVYGPAGRPDMSIFKFIKNIDAGEPIPVFGDGNQTRDFTYIDDIAEGTVLAAAPMGYEIINLGSDHPVRLRDVIMLIEENLHKKATIETIPRHAADVPATWAFIEKAKGLLGWEPKVSIETGIENTVKWYLENKEFLKKLKSSP